MSTSHIQLWPYIKKACLTDKQPAAGPEVGVTEAERRDDRRGDMLSE